MQFRRYLSFLFIFCWIPFVHGQTPEIILVGDSISGNCMPLATKAWLLEDANHIFNPAQVFQPTEQMLENMHPLETEISNLGFTTSTYWVWLRMRNEQPTAKSYYLETGRPITNVANLHLWANSPSSAGKFESQFNGDELPFDQRPVKNKHTVFDLTLQPGITYDILLELRSDGEVINLPVNLWEKESFNTFSSKENYYFGVYYGVLLFVIIIYFFFYIALKERVFLIYVVYVATIGFLNLSLDGLSYQILWPNSTWWASHSVLFFASTSILFVTFYVKEFLYLKERLPTFNKIFNGLIALCVLCTGFSLTNGITYELAYPVVNALGLASIFLVLWTLWVAHRKKFQVSIFFTAAFVVLMLCAIVFLLGNFNIIYNSLLVQNALKIGSKAEVILLSLSMAARYNEIQREKELAQSKTLESLEELNKLKDEQNVILEQQVETRTAEIESQKVELEHINKDITDSIRYAKRIQEAILPSDAYLQDLLPQHFVLYLPKDIVSGDFYWANELNGTAYVAAVDCTGHGVPGAFMSIVGQEGLNQAINEYKLSSPASILDHLNQAVSLTLRQNEKETSVRDGMDIALCSYNKETHVLEFAGANNPLYLIRNGEMQVTKGDKQPIGAYVDDVPNTFTSHRFELQAGDTFYIFSDGFPDQFGGPKGKKYLYKRLRETLVDIHQQPMAEQRDFLLKIFSDWKGDLEQVDDICIIGLTV